MLKRLEKEVHKDASGKTFLTKAWDDVPVVPPEFFGRDHYSTLAYVETRVVDHGGEVGSAQMRCNARRHRLCLHIGKGRPSPLHLRTQLSWNPSHGTRVRGGEVPFPEHDDWDCVDDMIACGWIEVVAVNLKSPGAEDSEFSLESCRLGLTPLGREVSAALRVHKMDGGNWRDFQWTGENDQKRGEAT